MMVRLSEDRLTFEIVGKSWRSSMPVARLPGTIRFYQKLRDRAGGRYAALYAETCHGLDRVQRELKDEGEK